MLVNWAASPKWTTPTCQPNRSFPLDFSDLVAELPFILMHPKPDDDEPLIGGERSPGRTIGNSDKLHPGAGGAGGGAGTGASDLNKNSTNRGDASKEDGPNLIQLDGWVFRVGRNKGSSVKGSCTKYVTLPPIGGGRGQVRFDKHYKISKGFTQKSYQGGRGGGQKCSNLVWHNLCVIPKGGTRCGHYNFMPSTSTVVCGFSGSLYVSPASDSGYIRGNVPRLIWVLFGCS